MPSLITWLSPFAGRLRLPWLFALTAVALLLDLFIPDPLPLLDEIALGLLTLLLANWRRRTSDARADR